MNKSESLKAINSIVIDVTKRCNLSCDYCFVTNRSNECMSFDVFKKTIKWFLTEASGVEKDLSVAFFGGEPLLYPEKIMDMTLFAKEASHVHGKNISIKLATNGTLLNADLIRFFKKNNVFVGLSLDGAPDTHNIYRRQNDKSGSFSLIEPWIPQLAQMGRLLTVSSTVNPKTVKSLYSNIIFLLDNGFQNIKLIPNAQTNWNDQEKDLLEEQLFAVAEKYVESKMNPLMKDFNFAAFEVFINKKIKAMTQVFPSHTPVCGAGKNLVGISTDGTIYPCASFTSLEKDEYKFGDVSTGITMFENYYKFSEENAINNCRLCSQCHLFSGGCGCYFINAKETGNIFEQHRVFCDLVKIMAKVAEDVFTKLYTSNYQSVIENEQNRFRRSIGC